MSADPAFAMVAARAHSAMCSIEELSSNGAVLVGQLPLARGELVSVTFDVDRAPITIPAVVIGAHGRGIVVVAFRDLSPAMHHFLRRLMEQLRSSLEPIRSEPLAKCSIT